MAKTPTQPQQGGTSTPPQQQSQQSGQQSGTPAGQQQGAQTIFKDWASI